MAHWNPHDAEVEKGKITGWRVYDYDQLKAFSESQFQALKKTSEYKKQIGKWKQENSMESLESMDSHLKTYILSYTAEFLDEAPSHRTLGLWAWILAAAIVLTVLACIIYPAAKKLLDQE